MKNVKLFQIFGNFGVSIDGRIVKNRSIFFDDNEVSFGASKLENMSNPYSENSQEFFEWERIKEEISEMNLLSALLNNAKEGSEIIILEL